MAKGCIYMETSSRGKRSSQTPRFVAEITIRGRRLRFRSTVLYSCQCWLEERQRESEAGNSENND